MLTPSPSDYNFYSDFSMHKNTRRSSLKIHHVFNAYEVECKSIWLKINVNDLKYQPPFIKVVAITCPQEPLFKNLKWFYLINHPNPMLESSKDWKVNYYNPISATLNSYCLIAWDQLKKYELKEYVPTLNLIYCSIKAHAISQISCNLSKVIGNVLYLSCGIKSLKSHPSIYS